MFPRPALGIGNAPRWRSCPIYSVWHYLAGHPRSSRTAITIGGRSCDPSICTSIALGSATAFPTCAAGSTITIAPRRHSRLGPRGRGQRSWFMSSSGETRTRSIRAGFWGLHGRVSDPDDEPGPPCRSRPLSRKNAGREGKGIAFHRLTGLLGTYANRALSGNHRLIRIAGPCARPARPSATDTMAQLAGIVMPLAGRIERTPLTFFVLAGAVVQ